MKQRTARPEEAPANAKFDKSRGAWSPDPNSESRANQRYMKPSNIA
jgi:hypothetical protein